MGLVEELARELGVEEEALRTFLKNIKKLPSKRKEPNGANEFIQSYCEEFKKVYGTNPTIDGKSAGLAKTIVKDLGLAKARALMITYLQMKRRDFVLKHHDLASFKLNLNAITVQADLGRSIDHADARQIGLADHNKSVIESHLKEKECKNSFSDF